MHFTFNNYLLATLYPEIPKTFITFIVLFINVVTQHTIACCSMQVVDITLVKYHFTNITSLRVVQQKHSGVLFKH
jgi:hypothetical protein